MIPVYQFVTEPGARWISKPNNGGELHPSDVVDELNRLLRQVEAAKASVQLVRSPLMGEIERLRYALERRDSLIEELRNRDAKQGFTVDRLRQEAADAQVGRWI